MDFVYALINFSLLAAILVIFGRKTVIAIFRGRRERIARELDEADRALSEADKALPEVPETQALLEALKSERDAARLEHDAENGAEKSAAHSSDSEDAASIVLNRTKNELHYLRRDAAMEVKNAMVDDIVDRIGKLMATGAYAAEIRQHENYYVDRILERIEITPGDMAYLKTRDVLYVTLTSAYELSPELVDKIGKKTAALLETVGGKQSFWVKTDSALIGGLRLRIGDTVYDCSVSNNIYLLKKKLKSLTVSVDDTAEHIAAELERAILEMPVSVSEFQLGRVLSVSDGICWLDGLADIMYGEVIEFECGERGMILDIEPDKIGCVVYGKYEHIESGSRVRRVGRIASVPVGNELLGRVVDALGNPIDGKWKIWNSKRRPIEFHAPGIPDRNSVSRPLHTGIKAIDALVPIGKGQRELIIGDRQTGKSAIAVDTIINQRGKNVICIYVAIGQKDSTVAELKAKLEKYGALEYTVIVSAPASASASLQYIAPFAGTAMGEYYMYEGRDVLMIYDDLSKHAVAYRELSLLLHRPSGREAYPGDVFYLHSRLLERSAQLSAELGGGSMTALPIIETQAGDISAYIPTNVISITDGQIFLESEIFNDGQRPAINVGLSVSRVGSAAQTRLMKQASSNLRTKLAQYRELAGFTQFSSDVDENTKKILSSGERMMAALRQGRYSPLPDWKQALIIFAVSEGFASGIAPENMEEFETRVCEHIQDAHPEMAELLKTGKKLSAEALSSLKAALCEVK